MRWLSSGRATKVSCIAIVAVLGMANGPAWAEGGDETSISSASQVFAAIEITGAQALRDDEMGELRGGFLGGLLGAFPDTNTVIIQDGDVTVSDSGPGLRTVSSPPRPGFSATATANSSSSSSTTGLSANMPAGPVSLISSTARSSDMPPRNTNP